MKSYTEAALRGFGKKGWDSYTEAALRGFGSYTNAALKGCGSYTNAALKGMGRKCGGGRLKKGSPEARARMAYLRSLRTKKGGGKKSFGALMMDMSSLGRFMNNARNSGSALKSMIKDAAMKYAQKQMDKGKSGGRRVIKRAGKKGGFSLSSIIPFIPLAENVAKKTWNWIGDLAKG